MWGRIREIIRKELRQALRDPRMRGMLFGPPLIQLIIFGYAVNLDVENSRIAWMDRDQTPASRELLTAFQGSRYFQVAAAPERETEVGELLDHGQVHAVVRVLPGFGRDVLRGDTAAVQVLVEGTNSNTASLVSSYSAQVIAGYAARVLAGQQPQRLLARGVTAPAGMKLPALTSRSRVWFNPELRSRTYFVPGVLVTSSCWSRCL